MTDLMRIINLKPTYSYTMQQIVNFRPPDWAIRLKSGTKGFQDLFHLYKNRNFPFHNPLVRRVEITG